jgi:hypothetical protein
VIASALNSSAIEGRAIFIEEAINGVRKDVSDVVSSVMVLLTFIRLAGHSGNI